MNTLISKKERVLSAVILSALLHIVVAAALVLSLSRAMPVSPWRQGLRLIWVSLEQSADRVATSSRRARADSPAQRQIGKQPTTIAAHPIRNSDTSRVLQRADDEVNVIQTPANNHPSPADTDRGAEFAGLIGQGGNGTAVFGKTEMLAYPLYKENSPPEYPAIARLRGYEGEVVLCVEILPNGRVGAVKIKKSSGYAILDQSALEAVRPWKFEPAKKSGAPVKVWVDLPIKFVLQNQNSKS